MWPGEILESFLEEAAALRFNLEEWIGESISRTKAGRKEV